MPFKKTVEENTELLMELLDQYKEVRKVQLMAETFGKTDVRDKYIEAEANILLLIVGAMQFIGRDA